MTEDFSESPFQNDVDLQGAGPEGSSADVIDAVLGSMDDLERRPVSQHVHVFEEAHDRLRDALARAGDDNRAT